MDNWADVLSSASFIPFGVAFLFASLRFWLLGKTGVARADVLATLVADTLVLIIGFGILLASQTRVTSLAAAYYCDATPFVASEIAHAYKVLNEYRITVFRVIPTIVAVCAVLIMALEASVWRASLITTIAMMTVILLIGTNVTARLETYRAKLQVKHRTPTLAAIVSSTAIGFHPRGESPVR